MSELIILSYFFLSFIALFSILEYKKLPIRNFLIFFVGIGLILIAGFRPPFFDRDYGMYYYMFAGKHETESKEPSFRFGLFLIKKVLNLDFDYLIFIYAFLGVSTKIYAIKKYSDFPLLSIIVYFSYLFLLQDMTQIRAGVASGLILLCVKPLYDRNWKVFLILAFTAFLFHYSAFFVFLFWFISPTKINKKVYALLIPVCYLVSTLLSGFLLAIQDVLPVFMQTKVNAYDFIQGTELNIFNAWQLMRIAIAYFAFYHIDRLQEFNKYSILLFKFYILSIGSLAALSFNPVYAGRIADLFAVADILLIPIIFSVIRPNLLGRIIVIAVSFAYFYLNFFYIGIFKP